MNANSRYCGRYRYLQLRYHIYLQGVKAIKEAVQQMVMALVALLQIAIPVVFFLLVFGLGQIADPNTSNASYFAWTWGYGLAVYGVLRIQRHAVLGSDSAYYLDSLPVSATTKRVADYVMLLVAVNLLLLLPLGLLVAILSNHWQTFATVTGIAALLPLCLMLATVMALLLYTLRREHFPLVSLLTLPGLLLLAQPEKVWLGLLFIGLWVDWHRPYRWVLPRTEAKYYWQLQLKYHLQHWQPHFQRILLTAITLLALTTMAKHVGAQEAALVRVALVSLTALLLSRVAFSLLQFQQEYQLYLVSLPMSLQQRRNWDVLLMLLFSSILLLPVIAVAKLSWPMAAIAVGQLWLGVWGVLKLGKLYFIPVLSAGCVVAWWVFQSVYSCRVCVLF